MTQAQNQTSNIIALDVGERRIGITAASTAARLPHPLKTLTRGNATLEELVALLSEQRATAVVIGLPRGLEGQTTAQTKVVQAFGSELKSHLHIPVHWQDEALTSKQAEAELEARGKPYQKGDIDALAAVYILEDFLREHQEVGV